MSERDGSIVETVSMTGTNSITFLDRLPDKRILVPWLIFKSNVLTFAVVVHRVIVQDENRMVPDFVFRVAGIWKKEISKDAEDECRSK